MYTPERIHPSSVSESSRSRARTRSAVASSVNQRPSRSSRSSTSKSPGAKATLPTAFLRKVTPTGDTVAKAVLPNIVVPLELRARMPLIAGRRYSRRHMTTSWTSPTDSPDDIVTGCPTSSDRRHVGVVSGVVLTSCIRFSMPLDSRPVKE
jgi:hypothetical protein